jgi:hypothetical protein
MTTTTEKLAQAACNALEGYMSMRATGLPCLPSFVEARIVEIEGALAAHEADKQPVEDEREAFEAWVEQEAGPGAEQDNRAGWVACLDWQAGRASAQAVPAWQPIETAPRDGTHILVWTECSDTAYVVCWADFDKNIRPYLCAKQRTVGWHLAWDGEHFGGMWAPTHWMPLPAAPKGD